MGVKVLSFYCRVALASALFFASFMSPAFAEIDSSTKNSSLTLIDSSSYNSSWNIEGMVQAHSVAATASPWLGISGAYRLSPAYSLGLRGFLPLSKPVDQSTYALQAYLRVRLYTGSRTSFFIEPEYSQNFYKVLPFSSGGISLGALHRLDRGLSVGVAGGVELANVVIDNIGLERRSNLAIYPKVAMFANFNF